MPSKLARHIATWCFSVAWVHAAEVARGAADALNRLNPTGHTISLTVPLTDGVVYLGDIPVTIDKEGQIALPTSRLLELLSQALNANVLAKLQQALVARASIGIDALPAAGIVIRYDPRKIELAVDIAPGQRGTRSIQVAALGRGRFGEYEHPATFSGYLNIRGSVDYVEQGTSPGLGSPVVFLDGAMRFKGIVLESQGTFQPDAATSFQRQGTRLVYDDRDHLVRWAIGDLRPLGRGFQAAPDIAGIGVFRTYGVLQPQSVARPSGRRSFRLERPSTVEITVNGHLVRRVRLDPGTYDLSDFPYTQGVDDVRITVTDDTGRTETIRFNLFADQTQLAKGLNEFGLYAGVKAPLGLSGPIYSDEGEVTGFYRHGFSDRLTLGANVQADAHSAMLGMETIVSTSFGAFGANVAASNVDSLGKGIATTLTFQTLLGGGSATTNSLSASVETWSGNFGPVGTLQSVNPFVYRAGANYSHAFNEALYAGLNASYAKGHAGNSDARVLGVSLGWRLSPTLNLNADAGYQNAITYAAGGPTPFNVNSAPGYQNAIDNSRGGLSARLTLTVRTSSNASTTIAYDSREQTARVAYQTHQGEGAGSYNALIAVEHSPQLTGIDGSINYLSSLAELGVDQFQNFGGGADSPPDSRTVFRFGTSAAFADGAFSVGRPIYDSFAIVTRHESLKDAGVILDPTTYGYTAQTTLLGTVTEPNMNSYNERTITIDAPDAPLGVDLGKGAFRVLPPYRSGYKLRVGSEYSVTVVGRELDDEGAPVAFVAGTATELAAPRREPIELFTNREGRFGITGLRPGRWRIDMHTDPSTSYLLDVPVGATGALKVGDIKPELGVRP
jgi:outer membrane usher protein